MAEAAGFWSYVHADDEGDGGRITQLAEQLSAEYRTITAEHLDLFVDREDLSWGDEWTKRIDDAIAGTTFFIPIITPSYFVSQQCRAELLKFASKATRLGLEQLLRPVYWVSVAELDRDGSASSDEAIALVSRYQWQNLRNVRLEDATSSLFRKAVHGLAFELASRAQVVTATVDDASAPPDLETESSRQSEPNEPDEEDSSPGLIDILADSEEAAPVLAEVLDKMTHEIETVGQIMEASTSQIVAADARGAGMRARLTITERVAKELAGPAEEIEDLGHEFASALLTLDPGIQLALDNAFEDTTAEGAEEFLASIEQLVSSAEPALLALGDMIHTAADVAKLSRSLRAPLGRMRRGLQGVLDGKRVLDDWARRVATIRADVSAGSLAQPGSSTDG